MSRVVALCDVEGCHFEASFTGLCDGHIGDFCGKHLMDGIYKSVAVEHKSVVVESFKFNKIILNPADLR